MVAPMAERKLAAPVRLEGFLGPFLRDMAAVIAWWCHGTQPQLTPQLRPRLHATALMLPQLRLLRPVLSGRGLP